MIYESPPPNFRNVFHASDIFITDPGDDGGFLGGVVGLPTLFVDRDILRCVVNIVNFQVLVA